MHSHKQDLVATSIIEMSQSFWDRENIYFFCPKYKGKLVK
jgi:hypothetical protein